MSPIDPNNRIFSDDFHKFVFQDQPIIVPAYTESPKKKFSLDKAKKSKQTKEKESSPWLPKKPKKEISDE